MKLELFASVSEAAVPYTPREGEEGYVVEYTLPYTHRVQVGVYATSAGEAEAKAEAAFNECTLWDNTTEMPLLYDDFDEEGDAGEPMVFSVIAKGAFPEAEASVKAVERNERARLALTALENGNIAEALRLAEGGRNAASIRNQ
ncbi:MAG: hypothetical protein KJ558_10055 [Gammaproteobacteria bacterium]|nr:hypothetical protein [Gammaproteobacteria bacterium]MBU1655149.1 hypothetical protein [Gammaproteobacteria bacterium]MBU1959960.1 hypothetical protein [Gammaproteobacteria bacterium]